VADGGDAGDACGGGRVRRYGRQAGISKGNWTTTFECACAAPWGCPPTLGNRRGQVLFWREDPVLQQLRLRCRSPSHRYWRGHLSTGRAVLEIVGPEEQQQRQEAANTKVLHYWPSQDGYAKGGP